MRRGSFSTGSCCAGVSLLSHQSRMLGARITHTRSVIQPQNLPLSEKISNLVRLSFRTCFFNVRRPPQSACIS